MTTWLRRARSLQYSRTPDWFGNSFRSSAHRKIFIIPPAIRRSFMISIAMEEDSQEGQTANRIHAMPTTLLSTQPRRLATSAASRIMYPKIAPAGSIHMLQSGSSPGFSEEPEEYEAKMLVFQAHARTGEATGEATQQSNGMAAGINMVCQAHARAYALQQQRNKVGYKALVDSGCDCAALKDDELQNRRRIRGRRPRNYGY